jgi:hypothetical protein
MSASLVLLMATAKKKLWKTDASSGHITNLKPSTLDFWSLWFDIYGLNSFIIMMIRDRQLRVSSRLRKCLQEIERNNRFAALLAVSRNELQQNTKINISKMLSFNFFFPRFMTTSIYGWKLSPSLFVFDQDNGSTPFGRIPFGRQTFGRHSLFNKRLVDQPI